MTPTLAKPQGMPHEHHWTADAFHKALAAGVFERPKHLELIHGRITDRMVQGAVHLSGRVRVARRLRSVLEPKYLLIEECSIQIAFDGVPVADIAVLRGSEGDYDGTLPSADDTVLLVEVAVSSEQGDLNSKVLLYAQAGIGDYWVVLPEAASVIVHRDPTPSGYDLIARLTAADTLSPLAASDATLAVCDLLGVSG